MTEIITAAGYMTEITDRGAKGRWIGGDNFRFSNAGLPEKIGGCVKASDNQFLGICRRIRNFKSLSLKRYLALATHVRFYIYDSGNFVNVTPLKSASSTLTDPFSTTATSSLVSVGDAGHGLNAGDYVVFDGATASPTDGITLDGTYIVVSITDSDNYVVDSGVIATNSESTFGGTVTYYYEIGIGLADATIGDGFGSGAWGDETWGTPRTSSDLFLQMRTVSIDAWGEDVVWNIRGGGIYIFDTSAGIVETNRATLISEAPDTAQGIIISPENRYLIALGAHDGVNNDPMLVAWCSQEDYTDWVPSAINTAGDYRLDRGTTIVTAAYSRGEILILTDESAYRMSPADYPVIFSFRHEASNCGAISPMCSVAYNGVVYWMGHNDFFIYDGAVQTIPCDVRDHVFNDINRKQTDKVYCGLVANYHEIWWFYPSANSSEIDRWVVYNYRGGYFFFGTFDDWESPRTAWLDNGEYSQNPIAADDDGYLWTQETGTDHGTAALPARILRNYDEIGDGEDRFGINRFIPDFRAISGNVTFTMYGKNYPQSTQIITKGAYVVTSTTERLNIRMRARQIAMEIACNGIGSHAEFGTLRVSTSGRGNR